MLVTFKLSMIKTRSIFWKENN